MFLYGLLGTTYIFFYYLCVVYNNFIVKYQLCLNKLFSVSKKKFNSKKCRYINFSIHPEDKDSNVYVGPDLNVIIASKTVKDLGVTMSNGMVWYGMVIFYLTY